MTDTYHTHIQGHGRVSIPAEVRKALNLSAGTEVLLRTEGRQVVITAVDDAFTQFRQLVADHFPPDRDLVAELLADRRAEAARDD